MTNKRVFFHGTASPLNKFSEDSIGLGYDPNSALGIHVSDCPLYASGYASKAAALNGDAQPRVYVIIYQPNNIHYIHHYDEFYGCEDDGTNTKDHFRELRSDLIEDECNLVEFDVDDDDPISTILNPDKAKIVLSLTVEQAISLGEEFIEKEINWDKSEEKLKMILDTLKLSGTELYHGTCTSLWSQKSNDGYIYLTKEIERAEMQAQYNAVDCNKSSKPIILKTEFTPELLLNYELKSNNNMHDSSGYKMWNESFEQIGNFVIAGDISKAPFTGISILTEKEKPNADIKFHLNKEQSPSPDFN